MGTFRNELPDLFRRLLDHTRRTEVPQSDPFSFAESALRQTLESTTNESDKTIVTRSIEDLARQRQELPNLKSHLRELGAKQVPIRVLPGSIPDRRLYVNNIILPSAQLREQLLHNLGTLTAGETLDNLLTLSAQYIDKTITLADRKKLVRAAVEPLIGRSITLVSRSSGHLVKIYLAPPGDMQLILNQKTADRTIKQGSSPTPVL